MEDMLQEMIDNGEILGKTLDEVRDIDFDGEEMEA
jgi:hypothetical protein